MNFFLLIQVFIKCWLSVPTRPFPTDSMASSTLIVQSDSSYNSASTATQLSTVARQQKNWQVRKTIVHKFKNQLNSFLVIQWFIFKNICKQVLNAILTYKSMAEMFSIKWFKLRRRPLPFPLRYSYSMVIAIEEG